METHGATHPYFPQDVALAKYTANVTPLPVLLGSFGGIIATVVTASLVLAKRIRPGLQFPEQLTLCWFVLCGFLHLFFEGYYILNHAELPGSQSLFAQLWKEYALSDSRYLTSDPFMLCIEGITVFIWGPLCMAIAACLVGGSSLRYPLQIVMCVAHLYGVALYYGTCYVEYHYRGVSHSRPEFLYYWVYYAGFNFPWVVVPSLLLHHDLRAVWDAFRDSDDAGSAQRGPGLYVAELKKER